MSAARLRGPAVSSVAPQAVGTAVLTCTLLLLFTKPKHGRWLRRKRSDVHSGACCHGSIVITCRRSTSTAFVAGFSFFTMVDASVVIPVTVRFFVTALINGQTED